MRRRAIAISTLALVTTGASLVLLAAESWPFTSWSILVFAAWIALPAWLFHVNAPVTLPRGGLGRALVILAPLVLVGGAGTIGYSVWREHDTSLPMAFIVVPAVQLAVVVPFLLFTGTDKPESEFVQEP